MKQTLNAHEEEVNSEFRNRGTRCLTTEITLQSKVIAQDKAFAILSFN